MVTHTKRSGLIGAAVLLAFWASLGHAGETTVDAQQLGILDRAVKYCGPVDPATKQKLEAKVARLLEGTSAAAVAQARSSADYKQSYASMDSFIGQVDARNAKVLCADTADR
jgi:hypothetical protein